jgi:hypothetical protein
VDGRIDLVFDVSDDGPDLGCRCRRNDGPCSCPAEITHL